ncbi:MAG TPA: CocE/NonD family hydrolase, partial [Myxococcota bacterium]|nr:CocE/NonD family hydrolase [Myxococcota bacterium]
MTLDSLVRGAGWRLQMLPRKLWLARQGIQVEQVDLELNSTVGYKLAARLTRPKNFPGKLRPLTISPAIHQGIAALEDQRSPISPSELAALGYAVLTWDPAGRGGSWGVEDFGGTEHQDDLRCAVRHLAGLEGMTGRVGVLSLSMGLVAAAGALARWPELPVSWLVDWEGPCDREILTAGGTKMEPANGHDLSDESWWPPREAVRHVGKLRCGYVRLQALPDHAQDQEIRHAERMIRAAALGELPWYQLNDHPRNSLPPRLVPTAVPALGG